MHKLALSFNEHPPSIMSASPSRIYEVYSTRIFSENSTMFAVTKNDWNKLFPMISSPSHDSDLVLNLSALGENSVIYNINFQSIVCQLNVNPIEKFFFKVTKKFIMWPMKVLHLSKLI